MDLLKEIMWYSWNGWPDSLHGWTKKMMFGDAFDAFAVENAGIKGLEVALEFL